MRNPICVLMLSSLLAASALADVPPGSASEVRPLLVGADLPQAVVKTVDDADFDLRAKLEGERSILIFYRGGW